MSPTRLRRLLTVAALTLTACLVAGCSGGSSAPKADSTPDNGTTLTMWVRNATDVLSKSLIDKYNATHKNKVKLTVIPSDSYQQKVGAAAGSGDLPDILTADVVFSPNYTAKGLFRDITPDLAAAGLAGKLAPSHMDAVTIDDKTYAVPLKLDSSLLFYNKDLFKKAGLDPETPPTNFDEVYQAAKAVRELGGNTYGYFLPANCAGCTFYVSVPTAAADGNPPLNPEGTKANVDNDSFAKIFSLYKKMIDEDIIPPSARTEDGSAWNNLFIAGQIGILPSGSFLTTDLKKKAKFDWGVTSFTNSDGSARSSLVGGDIMGVSKASKHSAQALDFITWTLSDEAQTEIVAKSGELPVRTDLAGNQYTASDERTKYMAEGLEHGYTPYALPFGEIFSDPNGPWLAMVRKAIYGSDTAGALRDGQPSIQTVLDNAQ